MTQWPFPPAAYIQTGEDLRRLAAALSNEPLLAVDTESNSLHAYQERVCLVQLSTRDADYLVDPLAITDMQPLGDLLANPAIEKVFHAAEYDLICLKRDFGFSARNIFDTMAAARILGHKAVGLGSLLSLYLGIEQDKSHQRDDWGKRPLSQASLLYAQMDTHYLPVVRDRLLAELEATGRLHEARESFADFEHVPLVENHRFDPEGYWRIGLPQSLNLRQMAILRELYLLRERYARERDCPPFKIFSDAALIAMAEAAPTTLSELASLDSVSQSQARRYGRALLRAIQRGKNRRVTRPPNGHTPVDPAVVERYTALRDWRKARAEQRGVDSDVIISKDALWTLAHKAPTRLEDMSDIRGLGPWRLSAYGEEILEVIRRFKNGHLR
jgi:ribonuclease D